MQRKLAVFAIISLLAQLCLTSPHVPGNFSHDEKHFLLNGERFQILGGEIEPQRVPPEYWRHRLQMARAMGINTIFTYTFWNNLEPSPGNWDFGGRNNLNLFMRMAKEEGLYVVLRPGPYVCAEHEWGGYPAWLSEVPGMAVRQHNEPYLDAVRKYTSRLAEELHDQQITEGGPILMVQLENEYGSFVAQSKGEIDPDDKTYLEASAGILRDNFNLMLYTNDGDTDELLRGGTLHGVLAQIDGNTKNGFAALDRLTDPTKRGPKLNGELYLTWLDHWGDELRRGGSEVNLTALLDDIQYILSTENSFNLFMFHGGTNWGYDNGANRVSWADALQPQITSYDYGAALDESGRPTKTYHALRDLIAKHLGTELPPIPSPVERSSIPEFSLKPATELFKVHKKAHKEQNSNPVSMEALGQNYGHVLYEHKVRKDVQGVLKAGDMPRDRVIVYVNDQRQGVIDATYYPPNNISMELKKGDTLRLLVENLGRVNFQYPTMLEQSKGIVGSVTIGDSKLVDDWISYSLPLEQVPRGVQGTHEVKDSNGPVFYTGSFKLPRHAKADMASDTFLEVPNGIKGQVWLNGELLGRYWTRGWQQSLYVPGAWLKVNGATNEVVVLELEPSPKIAMKARGVAERKWFPNEDPDEP